MKLPREMTNEELAMHLELWTALNDELLPGQVAFFEEAIWRLRLMVEVQDGKS
jgi:hypothetical protein